MAIRPGPEARRGAVWGTLAAAAACVVIAGLYLRTGFGYAFDFAFAVVVAAVLIPLVAVIVALLLTIARKLPRMATGMIVGSCSIVMLVWFPPQLGILMAIVVGLAEGFLGATIATFVAGRFAKRRGARRSSPHRSAVLAVASQHLYRLAARARWLDGEDHRRGSLRPSAMPAKLAAPNPAENGPYSVKTLFYGVGTDIRRPEYGSSVAIKTRTVDASDFFKDFKGWKRWARKKYWGFDVDKLPLNARVWYPDGPGPFPLALIVHGNHDMAEFSDPGYAYLGELLASRGFILASIDENFLNSGLFHDPPKQQPVRGWLLLEHLKLWREWNQTAGNPFRGKVDLARIALMGHSRGGEAAATAAAFNRMKYYPDDANIRFDYGFAIQAVVAIAPADGQYKPAGQHRWIEDVSYLTLQGAHDADVSSFMGSRQWDHVRYTQPGPWFKAEIYAYRANHGQFNTVWGRTDAGEPLQLALESQTVDAGRGAAAHLEDVHRRVSRGDAAKTAASTCRYSRIGAWRAHGCPTPSTSNRYQDASYMPLASFDEDADVTTTTAPGGRIAGRAPVYLA